MLHDSRLIEPAEASRSPLLSAVLAITAEIGRNADPSALLAAAADVIHRQLGYELVSIHLLDAASGDLALCAVAGHSASRINPGSYRLALGSGTPGRAIDSLRPARIDDLAEAALAPALGSGGIRSELSAPIVEQARPIGALTVAARAPEAFGPNDEQILAALAGPIAAALRAAGALKAEAERAAREALWLRMNRAFNSSLDLHQVLAQAVAEVGACLRADLCTVSLFDLQAGLLITEHEYKNPMLTERRSLRRRHTLTGSIEPLAAWLRGGELITASERHVPPALQSWWERNAQRHGLRSVAWAPIFGQADARYYGLGVMQVTHARDWTDDELGLLRGLAAQLSLALSNAQLYAAARETAAQLEATNAEQAAFTYTVSHDLQAPVVSIEGFASLLASRHHAQLDDRGREYLARIADNARFLHQLSEDLLELSRIGRLEQPDEDVAVGEVIRAVLGDLAARGAAVRLPEAWPVVRYSPARLRQVFSNLVSNAAKFIDPARAPQVEIGWGMAAAADNAASYDVEFFVRDNGIGIHPDDHQRIFHPFHRLKVINVDGSGVGLSIVKRIVEGRGGRVRVESAPGRGATFYFTAPLAEAHRPPAVDEPDADDSAQPGTGE